MHRKLRYAIVVASTAAIGPGMTQGNGAFDPQLDGGAMCGPPAGGQPAVLRALILAKTETAPFQPVPAKPALTTWREDPLQCDTEIERQVGLHIVVR